MLPNRTYRVLPTDREQGRTSGPCAAQQACKAQAATQAVQRLLPSSRAAVQARATCPAETLGGSKPPVIFVVDDEDKIRGAIRALLEDDDREVEDYDNCEAFLVAFHPGRKACLVIDAYLPCMNGLNFAAATP